MSLSTFAIALIVFACRDITVPQRGDNLAANHSLNLPGVVVVSPADMHGWAFSNDQPNSARTDSAVCRLVEGPGNAPAGTGSAELATSSATDEKALVLQDYKGTRFDRFTDLHYSTYRQSADAGNNLSIALQFNVDYDLTDAVTAYQGRIVFEPYQGKSGNVAPSTWQQWDAKAGKWWGTKTSVTKNGVATANPCVQATPCTWAQLLAAFPNMGVHATYGAVVLKAGSGWATFRGNVDDLTVGVAGVNTTFDFEPSSPVPATAPDSIPMAIWDSLTAPDNVLSDPPGIAGRVIRDFVYVGFKPSATLADRRAAIASVNGRVVGGAPIGLSEGVYAVRIPYVLVAGDSTSGPILRAIATLDQNPAVDMATVSLLTLPIAKYRRPLDGAGFTSWPLSTDSARGPNWSLAGIDAPMAWGCTTGTGVGVTLPSIAVIDEGLYAHTDLDANLGATREFANLVSDPSDSSEHGIMVAGVIGAVGDNQCRAVASRARIINISFGFGPKT